MISKKTKREDIFSHHNKDKIHGEVKSVQTKMKRKGKRERKEKKRKCMHMLEIYL